MLTLQQKFRLSNLRRSYAYDVATDETWKTMDESEMFSVLSIMDLTEKTAAALNNDASYRPSPQEMAESSLAVINTALGCLPYIAEQDPESAYAIGVTVKTWLEEYLSKIDKEFKNDSKVGPRSRGTDK